MPVENDSLKPLLERVKKLVSQACDLSSCFPDSSLAPRLPLTGKFSRPRLLLAIAHALSAEESDAVCLAAAVETIHNASLLHDDVVDEAAFRRGETSLNAKHGNRVAIMAGDILLARGWALACDLDNIKVHRAVANAVAKMAESQLMEDTRRGDVSVSTSDYFKIVDGKTSSLLCLCLELPALLAGLPEETIVRLHEAGVLLGRAFQSTDDLLDLNPRNSETGKDAFRDLAMGKMTYPYLLLRDQGGNNHKQMENLLGKQNPPANDVLDWITKAGIPELVKEHTSNWLDSAQAKLKELLPEERSGDVFELLASLVHRDR